MVVILGASRVLLGLALLGQAGPDYTAQAQRYRASHGFEALPADATALTAALDRGYAQLDVGLFDVRYPWPVLTDAKRIDELKQIVLGLIGCGQWKSE